MSCTTLARKPLPEQQRNSVAAENGDKAVDDVDGDAGKDGSRKKGHIVAKEAELETVLRERGAGRLKHGEDKVDNAAGNAD